MLGKFLNGYFSRIKDSLLARIYGLYEIRVGNQEPFSVILMGNIASPESEVFSQFDIKGSKYNRRVSTVSTPSIEHRASLDSRIVYKDQDFENFITHITPYDGNRLLKKLSKDVTFLEEQNIMDYSLFIKICAPHQTTNPFLFHSDEYSFYIGIIDFFQQYTCIKQAE